MFGDIGTSPLYAFRECFHPHLGLAVTPENILGILSLIFWSMTIAISGKYMVVVLRADNKGEGGILSLMALAREKLNKTNMEFVILSLGLIGAALLYGDGVITPAISVLSAVEGIAVVAPGASDWIIPITCTILAFVFLFQVAGTSRIGFVFGPLILIWFIVIGYLGVEWIIQYPEVLSALNPFYAADFFVRNGWLGLTVLGSVVLVITGGEALYADMGHFGRKPIRLAWYFIAMPGLVLNYFGQGALLLHSPESISNPFYLLAPASFQVPLIVIATLATVIASQALISGVFSLTRQAVQLGFWPRIQIIHTSSREIGQIYVPFINWALLFGVIWLVIAFKSSGGLAAAYGLAVTATMIITTVLAYVVSQRLWNWPLWLSISLFLPLLIIDVAFFIPNALKFTHGGWVPILIGFVIYLLMTTWKKGRRILGEALRAKSMSIEEFISLLETQKYHRVPGTAIYMSSVSSGIPVPLMVNLKHNKVVHERVIFLTITTKDVPAVPRGERVQLETLGPGLYRILACYGFMETPRIKHILDACRSQGLDIHVSDSTFVLGRETILPSGVPGMAIWREKLFALMTKNAQRPTAFFRIPPNQVIEVGIQIEI